MSAHASADHLLSLLSCVEMIARRPYIGVFISQAMSPASLLFPEFDVRNRWSPSGPIDKVDEMVGECYIATSAWRVDPNK